MGVAAGAERRLVVGVILVDGKARHPAVGFDLARIVAGGAVAPENSDPDETSVLELSINRPADRLHLVGVVVIEGVFAHALEVASSLLQTQRDLSSI